MQWGTGVLMEVSTAFWPQRRMPSGAGQEVMKESALAGGAGQEGGKEAQAEGKQVQRSRGLV